LFQSAGADAQDLTNVPGSNSVRMAMEEDIMDFQWDYTGTAWITYMGEVDPLTDEYEQYEAVRDADLANGLVWTEPSEVNNTYSIAVTSQTSEELGVTKLSELAELDESELTFCLDAEFASRNDGFEPMLEHYDNPAVPDDRGSPMHPVAIYQASANGECNYGQVFATDGRVPVLDLVVVEDDHAYYPRYKLPGVIQEEAHQQYPEVEELIDRLGE